MQQQDNQSNHFAPFCPLSSEELQRGFAWFAHMRANHPVSYSQQMNLWQVFRYTDVHRVINDHTIFSSEDVPNFSENIFLRDTIVARDLPDHRKLRNLITQAFSTRTIKRLTNNVTHIAQNLLDKHLPHGKMDIVSDLAFPLTTKMMAVLLGVPDKDWDLLCSWAKGPSSDPPPQTREEAIQMLNLLEQQIYDYFSQLLAERCREPHEDLVTALSTAHINGERLSEDELVKCCILLLVAGQETTENLLINALYCLTTYPESYNRLIQQPDLIPSAIEEVLRYLPPFWFTIRRTLTNVELGGQTIPANSIIQAWNATANRDRAHFPDHERFEIQRSPNHHLTFGHGIHFCIGAPLARLEAHIVLSMLLNQLKNIQRLPRIPIDTRPGPVFVILSLPVMFEHTSRRLSQGRRTTSTDYA